MTEINQKELRASLEYSRVLAGLSKTEVAEALKLHPNTYRRKENNPTSFTLSELLDLKIALKKDNIEEIFNLNKGDEKIAK